MDDDDDDDNNNLSRQYVFPATCLLTQGFLQYPALIPYNGYSLHRLSHITCSVNTMTFVTSTDLLGSRATRPYGLQPPVQWVPGLSRGVRCGRGVTLTSYPLIVPRSKIEWSYTSTLPKGLRGL
jgi:hypothetical protein